MIPLLVGLAVFFSVHLIPTSPELRNSFISRFGEGAYKLIFSIASLVGLVIIVFGYHKLQLMPGKNPVLWQPPTGLRHLALLLMLFSFILLAAAYIPSRLRDRAKHPMLAAVKFWALSHLLANGDLGSIILFGSFLAWAIYDRISLKSRDNRGPLGARPGTMAGDIAAVVVGAGLYLVMLFWGHAQLIGVTVLP